MSATCVPTRYGADSVPELRGAGRVELLEVIYAIDPSACERARRVKTAMELLGAGMRRREISGEIQRRFGVSQPTAWLVVDMAVDMAGPV
jgi:hypothetical protein